MRAAGSKKNRGLFSWLHCNRGATSIEYGLIAALVGISIIGGTGLVGDGLAAKFQVISAYLSDDGGPAGPPIRGRPGR